MDWYFFFFKAGFIKLFFGYVRMFKGIMLFFMRFFRGRGGGSFIIFLENVVIFWDDM